MATAGQSINRRRRAQRARARRREVVASLLPHLYAVYDGLVALRMLIAGKLRHMDPNKQAWTRLAQAIATVLGTVERQVRQNRLDQNTLSGIYCDLVRWQCRWRVDQEVPERLGRINAELRQLLVGCARVGGGQR